MNKYYIKTFNKLIAVKKMFDTREEAVKFLKDIIRLTNKTLYETDIENSYLLLRINTKKFPNYEKIYRTNATLKMPIEKKEKSPKDIQAIKQKLSKQYKFKTIDNQLNF